MIAQHPEGLFAHILKRTVKFHQPPNRHIPQALTKLARIDIAPYYSTYNMWPANEIYQSAFTKIPVEKTWRAQIIQGERAHIRATLDASSTFDIDGDRTIPRRLIHEKRKDGRSCRGKRNAAGFFKRFTPTNTTHRQHSWPGLTRTTTIREYTQSLYDSFPLRLYLG